MTLPTEYRRQLFYFLGGSGVYAGVIALLYVDWLLISPYLISFLLAASLAATLAPIRRIVHHYIHVIHHTSSKQRSSYIIKSTLIFSMLWCTLELIFRLNTSHRTLLIIIYLLTLSIYTLPVFMDGDTLTAVFIMCTLITLVLTLGVFIGNALIHESHIVISYSQQLFEEQKQTIERLKNKDTMISDTAKLCVYAVNYAKELNLPPAVYSSTGMDKTSAASFCASQIDFIQSNAETYIQRVRDMVQQYAPTAGQIVAGSVSEFISNLAKLPMQSIVFLLLLFYFLRYEPRIRQEIWKLSPFSADETNALVYSLNEKVSKTIGQSLFKSTGGFLTTYLAFYVAHFDISLIFAFLAGALELTPFTSPWLIWAPSLVISILRDGITKYPFRWSIMLTLYLNDLFLVNRQIDLVLFDLRGMYI
jgi:hypothetical protein